MSFKDVVYAENERLDGELSGDQKKNLYERSKYYILVKDIEAQISQQLAEGETIQGLQPFTIGDNSAVMNAGMMGLNYATTPAARNYVENFHDTRGNRMLIFTDRRIIFLVIIEFLEDGLFYSYPYEEIHSIFLKKRRVRGLSDKYGFDWYVLDFQAGDHIFSDMIFEKDYQLFLSFWEKIPAMKKVPRGKRVWRKHFVNRIWSNLNLWLTIMIGANWVFIGAFILVLIYFFFVILPSM